MRVPAEDLLKSDEMDLMALVAALWFGRWWILASTALVGGIAIAIAFMMTPVYRAATVLMPASTDNSGIQASVSSALGSLGGLASLAGVNVNSKTAEVEEAVAVLRSRQFIEGFIRDRQLLPVLFADEWDERAKKWHGGREPTLASAHKFFLKKVLTVVQDNRSSLVGMQVDWPQRERAAEWANALVDRLNAEMRERALSTTEASLRFLEQELARTSILGTQDAIGRLMEAQINQRMLANVTQQYAFRVIERATVPDEDDPLRPNKAVIVAIGVTVGGLLGVLGVLVAMLFVARDTGVRSRRSALPGTSP